MDKNRKQCTISGKDQNNQCTTWLYKHLTKKPLLFIKEITNTIWPLGPVSLAQPQANKLWDQFTGNFEFWKIGVSRGVHVGAVSCAFDEQCYQRIWNTLGNTQCMPRINRAVWKYNIGGILRDIFTTVIGIGGDNRCTNRVNWYIEDEWTQFREIVQRDKVSEWLVDGVGCLKVAKLSTCLISPLPFCKERKKGASVMISSVLSKFL